MDKYLYTLEHAKEVRHMPLLVPTYLRLVDLLIGQERTMEALQLIEQFEKRYRDRAPRPYAPTEKQISFLRNKKSHLKNAARPAEPLPAA
jgi:type II secretory pathway pseudopilin PulG